MTWSVVFDESVAEGSPVHDALLQYLDGIHEQLRESGSWEALLSHGERHLPYQQRVLTTALSSSLRQSLALSGQSGVPLSVPLLQETLSRHRDRLTGCFRRFEHAVARVANLGAKTSALLSVGEQLSTHQHASNFGGTRTDFVEFGVAQQSAGGVVIDIPVAPQ